LNRFSMAERPASLGTGRDLRPRQRFLHSR
jgi:hypothetical protein